MSPFRRLEPADRRLCPSFRDPSLGAGPDPLVAVPEPDMAQSPVPPLLHWGQAEAARRVIRRGLASLPGFPDPALWSAVHPCPAFRVPASAFLRSEPDLPVGSRVAVVRYS